MAFSRSSLALALVASVFAADTDWSEGDGCTSIIVANGGGAVKGTLTSHTDDCSKIHSGLQMLTTKSEHPNPQWSAISESAKSPQQITNQVHSSQSSIIVLVYAPLPFH
jgi:hypothetical protein